MDDDKKVARIEMKNENPIVIPDIHIEIDQGLTRHLHYISIYDEKGKNDKFKLPKDILSQIDIDVQRGIKLSSLINLIVPTMKKIYKKIIFKMLGCLSFQNNKGFGGINTFFDISGKPNISLGDPNKPKESGMQERTLDDLKNYCREQIEKGILIGRYRIILKDIEIKFLEKSVFNIPVYFTPPTI